MDASQHLLVQTQAIGSMHFGQLRHSRFDVRGIRASEPETQSAKAVAHQTVPQLLPSRVETHPTSRRGSFPPGENRFNNWGPQNSIGHSSYLVKALLR